MAEYQTNQFAPTNLTELPNSCANTDEFTAAGSLQDRCSDTTGESKPNQTDSIPQELIKPRSNRPISKDRRRVTSQNLVLHYIVPCMTSYGMCIVDNFLGDRLGDRILLEVERIHEDGKMQDGQLACRNLGETKPIRGDQIIWVEGTEPGFHNVGVLLSKIDKLITFADGQLGSYKIRGRHKVSIVCVVFYTLSLLESFILVIVQH